MEAKRAMPRSGQKRVDEIMRVRLALASEESVLTVAERSAILASAEAKDMNGVYQEQAFLLKIRQESERDPVHVMKVISSYISHLES
jgi:hypothetical protein